MSIAKMIKMSGQTPGCLEDLHEYVCASSKTKAGTLIGTNNILSKLPVMEMKTVKQLFNKTDKRQCIHLVISLTPDQKERTSESYIPIADKIARLFADFQCFYAVHTDSPTRHIHLVFNSVSAFDGKKFHQSKSDLARFKQRCNDILVHSNFDPIILSADKIWDLQDYSNATNYDFLEVQEFVASANLADYYEELDFPSIGAFWQSEIGQYNYGGSSMNQTNSMLAPIPAAQNQPALQQQYPIASPTELPTLTVAPGYVIVRENPNTPPEQTAALVRELAMCDHDTAKFTGNIAAAINRQAAAYGMQQNMILSPTPIIEIDRTGSGGGVNSDKIIETTFTIDEGGKT